MGLKEASCVLENLAILRHLHWSFSLTHEPGSGWQPWQLLRDEPGDVSFSIDRVGPEVYSLFTSFSQNQLQKEFSKRDRNTSPTVKLGIPVHSCKFDKCRPI